MTLSPTRLAELYRKACELELQAFKPGNVSVYADGHDMTVADFRISAEVSATPLCNPDYCLGEKIYYAVKATREAVACNTNLGIILLAAPLLQAALCYSGLTLRESLRRVLNASTITDADWVFRAIALAAPGGLGEAQEQDVHSSATVTLKAAMGLASDKDRIALQYLTDYEDIFDFAILSYYNAMNIWKSKSWSAVAVYTALLSKFPDSHIERKYGNQYSGMIIQTMAKLSRALATPTPEQVMPLLYQADQELKSRRINPGTTADMTVATLLAVLLQEEWA
ncbi:MAG: triphosphoribosyl-dephospho-CoA synthase [Methylovulum miyakonense]|uniref:triphosphoribosyl-dephospho-CoA synthase n=1 Tax=Methylovulum miyakonense TaxID=645578 RepID=UPI003BB7C692